MNAKIYVAAALLLGSFVAVSMAAAPAHAAALACAGGYHADRQGNCQPDNGYVDSRCQAGFEAAPSPDPVGYRCAPIPEGYQG
jgi:hypothetical protein